MTKNEKSPRLEFLRKLCADLPEEKIQEAEDNFWRYLKTVNAISQHLDLSPVPHSAEDIPSNDSPSSRIRTNILSQ